MQSIAIIGKSTVYSWSGILIALAALSAILMALALRARQEKPLAPMAWLAVLSILLSLPLSRLIHWYCNTGSYTSLAAAMTDLGSGGFAPVGVFAGTLLAALLLRVLRAYEDFASVLDCLGPAAALGMAAGRLSCFFSTMNRGKFVLAAPALHRLPFTVATATASGEIEWRIATFFWESIVAFAIFVVLLLFFLITLRRGSRRDGDVFLLFLALYGASHVLLDSMRYDGLFLRSNGFVSLPQICCTAALVFTAVLLSMRSVKKSGLMRRHFVLWTLLLLCLGGGGYMEYYVQRHGNLFVQAYGIMAVCLMGIVVIVSLLLRDTRLEKAN
ncbi:MAG: prolipoprotein diacylglyceryl transferase [Ruminococcaceae bacterium]|nr:prolipoprotein diacylglyceryl transferase [Oscillospiraceae bacterium]